MDIISRKIDKLGRIVLPMDFRKALGLEGEAEVVLSIRGNAITVKGAKRVCQITFTFNCTHYFQKVYILKQETPL